MRIPRPAPFVLLLLASCGTPALWMTRADGSAEKVRDGRLYSLKAKDGLREGESLRVEEGVFELSSEGVFVRIHGPARFTLEGKTALRTRFVLDWGAAEVRRNTGTPDVVVGTASSALVLREGGSAWVAAAEDGAALFSGEGRVYARAETPIILEPGEEVEVGPDGAPGRVHRAVLRSEEGARLWREARRAASAGRENDLARFAAFRVRSEAEALNEQADRLRDLRRRLDAPENVRVAAEESARAAVSLTRLSAAGYLASVLSSDETQPLPRDLERGVRRARVMLERLDEALAR